MAVLAPARAERGSGAVINVSTMAAALGVSEMALYGSSKVAVNLLTKACRIRPARGPGQRRAADRADAGRGGRGVTRSPAVPGGTLVLDSEGLAKAVLRDRTVTGWLALSDDLRVITSAATLVEVVHPRINRPALE